MAGTQETLYRELGSVDLSLSWSESELPERERTKHVHRLHPYLGKFVPQLVEALLDRYVTAGGRVLDPFAGSGTTLVQALEQGYDAAGVDVASFNCLLMRVKTRPFNLDALRRDLLWAHAQAEAFDPTGRVPADASRFVRDWYAPAAAEELLHFRSLVDQVGSADVLNVILARSARSARRTTHFDLDFPTRRSWRSTGATSTSAPAVPSNRPGGSCCATRWTRLLASSRSPPRERRAPGGSAPRRRPAARSRHGGRRRRHLAPYPGLIDYHGQHRYAYELSGWTSVRTPSSAARARHGSPGDPGVRRGRRGGSETPAGHFVMGRQSASSSTTAATSTATCSTGPGCGSSTGSTSRQSPHGSPRRGVLRVGDHRHRRLTAPRAGHGYRRMQGFCQG